MVARCSLEAKILVRIQVPQPSCAPELNKRIMTVVVAANLIEGPILASDSRATQRSNKKPSDTATKIIPITENLIAGIVGNPIQAGSLLRALVIKVNQKGKEIINPPKLKETIKEVAEETDIVDANDSRCHVIFAGLDRQNKQRVHTDKLRFYLEKEHETIVEGQAGLGLIIKLMDPKFDAVIEFNFPRSFIYDLSYPLNDISEVGILELATWGSGGTFIKNRMEKDFHKLWDLKTLDKVPFFKRMIFAIALGDIIKDAPPENYIGGLPQIVILDSKSGLGFQSYSRNGFDGKPSVTMKFVGDSWEQIDEKSGRVVKTTPSIFSPRKFDPTEIVDFAI